MTRLFLLIVLNVFSLKITYQKELIVNLEKIVESVNNNLNNTWQADTYGFEEVGLNQFVSNKLGVEVHANDSYLRNNSEHEPKEINIQDFPKNYDPRLIYKYCKTIRHISDQSNCGSAWVISSIDVFSDRLCIQSLGFFNRPLSANYVLGCNKESNGCWGGYVNEAWNFFKTNGVITGGGYESDEGCQPYEVRPCGYPRKLPCSFETSLTPKCRKTKCTNEWYESKYEKKMYKMKTWYYLPPKENRIKTDIILFGPVVATFYMSLDFLTYKSGVYQQQKGQYSIGFHAVRVIGWGEENGVKYWLAANSWGTEWGENGFFKILRGENHCHFEDNMRSGIPIPYFL